MLTCKTGVINRVRRHRKSCSELIVNDKVCVYKTLKTLISSVNDKKARNDI